jgi:glucose-6-phosphate 1-dehydrogenase
MALDPLEYIGDGAGASKKPHACVLVIFGASGDLTKRKLIPALYNLALEKRLPERFAVVGYARSDMTHEAFREKMREDVKEFSRTGLQDEAVWQQFASTLYYVRGGYDENDGFQTLKEFVDGFDRGSRVLPARVFYLAIPPDLYGIAAERIAAAGLAHKESDGETRCRVVIEKPFGTDLQTARDLNHRIHEVFDERQIYRIDHYLGKETVQNLMALRFANALFEPLWNAAHIDHVQITVAESLGVEERAGYYDTAGAMRDMVQNHLLQLLCLVAMEPPPSLEADAVRDEKLKVLRALKPIGEANAASLTVRGQYRAGASAGGAVRGYLEELGSAGSETETFVALKAEVANWRWAGVPFYLRTGKRLAARVSEIVIGFRSVPHSAFGEQVGPLQPNRLVIRLQPDEGVKLWLMIKDPGPGGIRLSHVPLDMSFAEAFKVRNPDAYERLILDVVRGNQTLFMRRDEVEAAWRWVDPILQAWRAGKEGPRPYTAGTWGPSAAIALIERDGRTWQEDGA